MSHLVLNQPFPQAVAKSEATDRDGQRHRLQSLWEQGPALLLFVRRFGCVGCSVHMADLNPRLPELRSLGIEVGILGIGETHFLDGFVERYGLKGSGIRVWSTPTPEIHLAAGLKRSWWATFGLPAIRDLFLGSLQGHFNQDLQGDLLQLGGSVLVDRCGIVRYLHTGQSLTDHALTSDILAVAMKLWLARQQGEG